MNFVGKVSSNWACRVDYLDIDGHFGNQISGSLEQSVNSFSILRVRKSIRTPLGLNLAVAHNRSCCGENTLEQLVGNFKASCAGLDSLVSKLVDSRLILRSHLELELVSGIEIARILSTKLSGISELRLTCAQSNLGQAEKSKTSGDLEFSKTLEFLCQNLD